MNWHLIVYYLRKILPIKQNYKTHDVKILAIVGGFKTWRHYFGDATHTILLFTNHNNLKDFIKTTCLSTCQI